MVGIKTLSFAALAVGALAGSITTTEAGKTFKIGVTFKDKQTLYITNSGIASPNIADGIECAITEGAIGCGSDKKAFTYSEFHTVDALKPIKPDNKNKNWAIGQDNVLFWGAVPAGKKSVSFSRMSAGSKNAIYGEVCSTFDHHDLFPGTGLGDFWDKGVAKAYFA